MMQKTNSQKIAEVVGSTSQVLDVDIEKVVTDSRQAQAGDLFVALRGEKFDGHDFVSELINRGIALAVVDHVVEGVPHNRQLVVHDTLEAFGKLGAYNRSLYRGKVIGLTGSAGKTTTKEEIKCVLSQFAKTYATSGNHNNFVGVPRSLLDLDMEAPYAVIEMGMSAKGEISRLTSYVKPDIAVVTNVYPMHIEFFKNVEGIAEAKAEIFEGLPANGGVAVINEDTLFADLLMRRAEEHHARVVCFGKNHHPEAVLQLPEEGEHYLYNAWCALSVAEVLGLDLTKAAAALKSFGALPGRGKKNVLRLPSGGTYTLIDDSYSGQPEAMKLGLKALAAMKTKGRKIAVLGKMAELGDTSQAQHVDVGKVAAASHLDVVIGVCPETKDILKQLPDGVEQHYFENKDGLDDFLVNKLLQNNDIVLIKGARYSSKLYQVTESLIKKGSES